MGPFGEPRPVLRGFKERPEALLVEGNRLLIGTSTGNLHVYLLEDEGEGSKQETTTTFRLSKTPKPIEALGYIKDISSLVTLVDGSVSLFAFPLKDTVPKPRVLPQTKGALCFAVYSTIIRFNEQGEEVKEGESAGVPSVVSSLAVGLRRKIVIYTWKDGEESQVKELALPHTPRAIQFFAHRNLLLAYTATELVSLSLPHMAVTEISLPPVASTSTLGMNVGKLGVGMGNLGYWSMGIGGGNKKPILVKSSVGVFIPRENHTILINSEGKASSKTASMSEDGSNVIWPAPMEDATCLNSYLVSLFPPNTLPSPTSNGQTNAPSIPHPGFSIQIRSYLYPTSYIQTIQQPFNMAMIDQTSPSPSPATAHAHLNSPLRLLTPASSSTIYVVSAPTDRNQLTTEGTTIWSISMKKWLTQIDELIEDGLYVEALTLMATLDEAELPEKTARVKHAKTLLAVQQFKDGEHLTALRALAELDINPARVLGLFPELVSGRLSTPRNKWIELFSGKLTTAEDPTSRESANAPDEAFSEGVVSPVVEPSDGEGTTLTTALKSIEGYFGKKGPDDFAAEGHEVAVAKEKIKEKPDDQLSKAIEALLEYLPDRRRKVQALIDPPVNQEEMSSLSSLPMRMLMDIPSVPAGQLTPEELTIYAQVIDTALFTAYLVVRPGLIGPLCRIGNWCEVNEVEGLLRAREKYTDLVSLYSGKRMHGKALSLLKEMATKEDDDEEKLEPSIRYLRKLGPEHIDQIFDSSHWILQQNRDLGLQIFTSDEVELPRARVAQFLESFDPELCIRYLHHLIDDRGEQNVQFHNHLGLLLISITANYEKKGRDALSRRYYQNLLDFLKQTSIYQTDRLYGALPSDGMFEARAILLGRLGRHESALDIYVHQLQDYAKAEEYCIRLYSGGSQTESIFMSLLRTFLRPQNQQQKLSLLPMSGGSQRKVRLQPALDLISRHSPRLDAFATLDLLPPLCTAQDIRQFLIEVLRIPTFETMVQRELWNTRKQHLSEHLAALESRRVKVTDSRICPNCQKRLGNTVVAVHLPRGDVTHYHCRDAYSEKLKVSPSLKHLPRPVR